MKFLSGSRRKRLENRSGNTRQEPGLLERDLGSDEYAYWAAMIREEKERRIRENPKAYVREEVEEARDLLDQGMYQVALSSVRVLKLDAKEKNLSLPADIDDLEKRVLAEGAYGFYREYLTHQDPEHPFARNDLAMAKIFAKGGELNFSEIEEAKGEITKERVQEILSEGREGCLPRFFRPQSSGESKG